MPKTVKHGWTHRPRSEGGTDPIDFTATAGLPAAICQMDNRSLSLGVGITNLPFRWIAWNDDSVFGYATVAGTPKRARYLTVNREGVYLVRQVCNWNSAFTLGDDPYLVITLELGGVEDQLITTASDAVLDEWNYPITLTQRKTDDLDYLSIQNNAYFNYTAAEFGTAVLGIGMALGTLNARTKTVGAFMAVTWIGEPTTLQTLV